MTCEAIVDDGLIERYLAGLLSEPESEALESHYLTCARCQAELRLGSAIRAVLPEVEAAAREPDRGAADVAVPRFGRRARIGAVAAAIAAVLAGVLLFDPLDVERSGHRDAAPGAEAVPALEVPVGAAEAIETFRWRPAASADLYRVTLYDATGNVLWEVETSEIQAALPDSVRLERGALYLWQVAARVGWDRWISSELVRFTLTAP